MIFSRQLLVMGLLSPGGPLSTHDTNQFLLCQEGLGVTAGISFFNLHLNKEKFPVKTVIPVAINNRDVDLEFVFIIVSK